MSFGRAFAALSGASLISMAAQLVRGKLAAVFLGAAGVGIFNQLSLMWNLFQLGGSLGAFNGMIQHGATAMATEDDAALRRLVSTFTILISVVSCLLAAVGVIFAADLSDWLLHDGGAHADLVALLLLGIPITSTTQIYRALLSAARAVPKLVRSQIISDVGGVVVFAALIVPLGLTGAILGFMTSHLLLFLVQVSAVRAVLGASLLRPRLGQFSWRVLRSNLGFGASALVMITLSNISVLLVSRLIIDRMGVDANGIFANGWRIASVYLGAVTATALSYTLPTVSRCKTSAEMGWEVNATLRFYFYALPALMAAIIAGGELIVRVILSQEFLPVAALLLIFIPAELVRIAGETLSIPFLARRRIAIHTLLYFVQASLFVVAAELLVPRFGVAGGAGAYAIGSISGALLTLVACMLCFGFRVDRLTATTFARAVLLLGAVAATCLRFPFGIERLALCTLFIAAWAALSLRDENARELVRRLRHRLSGGDPSEA